MIACIIEFGVKEGRDDDRKRLLTELFIEIKTIPGFLSKETFDDVDRPGRRITISCWADADALRTWMRNAAHVRAIGPGKRKIFSHYNIKIATIEREMGPIEVVSFNVGGNVRFPIRDTTTRVYTKVWEMCALAGFFAGRAAAIGARQEGASRDRS